MNINKIKEEFPGHSFDLTGNGCDDETELWIDGRYAFSQDEDSFTGNGDVDYEVIRDLVAETLLTNNQ